jgi:CRP-like cAMP-binding protein
MMSQPPDDPALRSDAAVEALERKPRQAPQPAPPDSLPRNRLLAALTAEEQLSLLPHLERMDLPIKYPFYEPNQPISHVYFLVGGVGSLLMLGQHGEAVEVSTVGNEGMIGLPVFLGADSTPGMAFMQVPDAGLRMPVTAFRQQVTPGTRLHLLLRRYTQTLMVQMAQGVACNRLHTIEQRAARWLLQTRDRVGANTFPLTHEFLAQMLGVRRAGVSEVAAALQADGLITYTRGIMTILDHAGLERHACECYHIIQDELARMLDNL